MQSVTVYCTPWKDFFFYCLSLLPHLPRFVLIDMMRTVLNERPEYVMQPSDAEVPTELNINNSLGIWRYSFN